MAMDIANNIVNISQKLYTEETEKSLSKKKAALTHNIIILEIYYNYIDNYNNTEYSSDQGIYKFSKDDKKDLYWIIKYDSFFKNFASVNIKNNPKFIEKIIADLEVTLDIDSNEYASRKDFIIKIKIPNYSFEGEINVENYHFIERYQKYTTLQTIVRESIDFINNIDILI